MPQPSSRLLEAAYKAQSIRELCSLLAELASQPDWTFDYSKFPVWGPMTKAVTERIRASSEEGDLISWDTTDQSTPLYLMRVSYGDHFKVFVDEGD